MATQRTITDYRQEISVKNFRFNRFMSVRYVLAVFFFANVYWLIFSLLMQSVAAIIPLLLIICSILAISEQIKLFWNHDNRLVLTNLYHKVQMTIILLVVCLTWHESIFTRLFTFLNYSSETVLVIYGLLGVGLVLSAFLSHKLKAISLNQDKKYLLIKQYEKHQK